MEFEEARERKLAVILHADVVSSTALVQQHEALAHDRITRAFSRFSETIQSYRGIVQEIRGDALVAEFPRASDAVSAALAFQQLNIANNEQLTDGIAPAVRIGISLGEVVVADDTVTGPGVVLAQRVEQLANPGGVCTTAAIYEAAPGRLPFDYLDMGPQSAKGFDEPVHVYTVALKSNAALPSPELSSSVSKKLKAPQRRFGLTSAVAVSSIALGGLLIWIQPWSPEIRAANPEKLAFELPDEPSIAVLPFSGVGGDASKEQLLDGLTETLTAALAAAPRMFVIAKGSTSVYQGKNAEPKTVAEELGVRYVLKGNVQWTADKMRVTVQLIDAIDGKSIWGERYDRRVENIFEVQDDIVKRILAEIEGKLVWEGSPAIWAGMTDSLDSYLHYIKGQKALFKFSEADNHVAEEHARKAIELDPGFSSAWNLLGWAQHHAANRGWGSSPKEEFWSAAEQHARKAISLAPKYGSPRGLLSTIKFSRGQFAASASICEEAISVAPNEAIALATCALNMSRAGKPDLGVDLIDRAMRLSPRHPLWFLYTKGVISIAVGDYKAAIVALERLRDRQPDGSFASGAHALLAIAYHNTNRPEDAARSVATLLKLTPNASAIHILRNFPSKYAPEIREHFTKLLIAAGIPEQPAR